jgi:3-dehydroquinate dehydratase-2
MNLKIMVLNGPNLNMLGTRQPEIYGYDTLADVEGRLAKMAKAGGFDLVFRQSNYEGEMVTWIQEARTTCAGIIINPAAYTHTSVAIRDALLMCDMPIIELHLSNTHKRDAFRHHSFVSGVATAVMMGLGPHGYEVAFGAMTHLVKQGQGMAAAKPAAQKKPATQRKTAAKKKA